MMGGGSANRVFDASERQDRIVVAGEEFCSNHDLQLTMVIKRSPSTQKPEHQLLLLDSGSNHGGSLLLEDDCITRFTFQHKRILRDCDGNSVLTLRNKFISVHDTWYIYSGDGSSAAAAEGQNQQHCLLTVRRGRMLQLSTELHAAAPSAPEKPVFTLRADFFSRSCKIFSGTRCIAKMKAKKVSKSVQQPCGVFQVSIYSGVDYALVAALLIIYMQVDRKKFNIPTS